MPALHVAVLREHIESVFVNVKVSLASGLRVTANSSITDEMGQ